MSLKKEFINKNLKLQSKILSEIELFEAGNSTRNIYQLQTIIKELKLCNNMKNIPLVFPRIVVDSWDFSDELGIELLELAELYKKL